jgi:hypothetical protein
VQSVDGVTLVLNMSAATTRSAESALRAASRGGRLIAVIASPTFGEYSADFRKTVADRADTVLTVDGEHPLADAEKALIATLKDGDVVFVCGGREHGLCDLVRRVFGITDGFIPGAS